MATIRKRGAKWQVQIRRKGIAPITRTFAKHSDALEWSRHVEGLADRRGLPIDSKILDTITFGEVMERYRDQVVPRKRGHEIEAIVINAMLRRGLAKLPLSQLTTWHLSRHRDERLKTVKAATYLRELSIIQHALDIARRDWGIPLPENVARHVSKPKAPRGRDRRLEPGELEALIDGTKRCRNKEVALAIRLALETAMRRGELLAIRWDEINFQTRTLHIPLTKNGHPRTIPLTAEAVKLLRAHQNNQDQVFTITGNSLRLAWVRLCRRAKIENLRFHDLRHEAISRFFERGLSIPEVALISGHRDPRMLFRYTHLRAEAVAHKLTTCS